MSAKQRNELVRILIALAAFIVAILLPLQGIARMVVYLAIYAFIGWDVIWKAIRNILRGQVFDENFLMAIATIGAMILGDYREAVTVILFYQVGEWFQGYALGKSRRSITQLMDIRPDYANLRQPDGNLTQVSPEDIAVGDTIVVKPGERVPLDGIVLEGASSLDTSALTGESAPRDVHQDEELFSGCVNLTGTLVVRVTKPYGESTVARILDLVENSSSKKARAENFITRFARYYTPAVCAAALALAVLPPLITGQPFGPWVYRALTFLVISCPCALVISVPLSFFGGIGGASKLGVLIKGSNYLEALATADTVVFDKTGTLTKGRFTVTQIETQGITRQQLLEYAAYAEHYSGHPIAQSIKKAYGKTIDPARVALAEEVPGYGVKANIDGQEVLAGNAKMMEQSGLAYLQDAPAGTVVHVAVNNKYCGYLLVEDEIKADAKNAIDKLKQLGVTQTVMLTGDNDTVGRSVAKRLNIDTVYTQLLPGDKVEKVEALLEAPGKKGTLAFVGDGINDAPVLARADVGIAMGALGADAAIEAADVVIMTDEPSKIPAAVQVSRRTLRIVKQNIVFALGVKAVVLLLGAFGLASMWMAVFADVGVSVIAILNAMRALRVKQIAAQTQATPTQDDSPQIAA